MYESLVSGVREIKRGGCRLEYERYKIQVTQTIRRHPAYHGLDFIDLDSDPHPVNDNSTSCMAQDLQGAGSSFQGTIPGVGRVEGEEELQVVHQVEFVPAMVGLPRGSL